MRSVPGGGKSYEANKIIEESQGQGLTATIHSTDNYFMVRVTNEEVVYKFDPTNLGKYHAQNQEAARQSMLDGVDVVIIDNTNIQSAHFLPYIEAADELDYGVEFREPTSSWWLAARPRIGVTKQGREAEQMAEEFAKRTSHNVPAFAIARMIFQWENEDRFNKKTKELLEKIRSKTR